MTDDIIDLDPRPRREFRGVIDLTPQQRNLYESTLQLRDTALDRLAAQFERRFDALIAREMRAFPKRALTIDDGMGLISADVDGWFSTSMFVPHTPTVAKTLRLALERIQFVACLAGDALHVSASHRHFPPLRQPQPGPGSICWKKLSDRPDVLVVETPRMFLALIGSARGKRPPLGGPWRLVTWSGGDARAAQRYLCERAQCRYYADGRRVLRSKGPSC